MQVDLSASLPCLYCMLGEFYMSTDTVVQNLLLAF